eukprot:TRINITY_DN8248_c0_g1_i1.p1 TRINITY_DN8248_c0_g1~~TRINITY_DN8248_c0_g1_i1.p1  ORF type:complete len:307 (-),score=48.26 TRINITY_DN8248_c0_g1_i1:125-1045(-)
MEQVNNESESFVLGEDELYLIFTVLFSMETYFMEATKALASNEKLLSRSKEEKTILGHFFNVQLVCREWNRVSRSALDPRLLNQLPMIRAVEKGSAEGVRSILMDHRVDPTTCGNYCLENAVTNGRVNIVKILLEDERVNPSSGSDRLLSLAIASGSKEMMEVLLSHPGIVVRNEELDLHVWVIRNVTPLLVHRLLTMPSTSPSRFFDNIVRRGNEDALKILLKDELFDPSADQNHAIIYASTTGTPNMVKALLMDPRVDPTAKGNQAYKEGKKENRKILLHDPRVKQKLEEEGGKGFLSKIFGKT